jgi:hypothetical protein
VKLHLKLSAKTAAALRRGRGTLAIKLAASASDAAGAHASAGRTLLAN